MGMLQTSQKISSVQHDVSSPVPVFLQADQKRYSRHPEIEPLSPIPGYDKTLDLKEHGDATFLLQRIFFLTPLRRVSNSNSVFPHIGQGS